MLTAVESGAGHPDCQIMVFTCGRNMSKKTCAKSAGPRASPNDDASWASLRSISGPARVDSTACLLMPKNRPNASRQRAQPMPLSHFVFLEENVISQEPAHVGIVLGGGRIDHGPNSPGEREAAPILGSGLG